MEYRAYVHRINAIYVLFYYDIDLWFLILVFWIRKSNVFINFKFKRNIGIIPMFLFLLKIKFYSRILNKEKG